MSIAYDQCPRCASSRVRTAFVEQASDATVACDLCAAAQYGRIAFAPIDEICKHYGFDVEIPRPSGFVELLRVSLDSSSDRSVLWGESDEPNHHALLNSGIAASGNPSTDAGNSFYRLVARLADQI